MNQMLQELRAGLGEADVAVKYQAHTSRMTNVFQWWLIGGSGQLHSGDGGAVR